MNEEKEPIDTAQEAAPCRREDRKAENAVSIADRKSLADSAEDTAGADSESRAEVAKTLADPPSSDGSGTPEKSSASDSFFPAEKKEKAPEETVEVVGVRFRSAGKSYYFDPGRLKLRVGDAVIVETARGIEFGTVNIANRQVPLSTVTPPLRIVMRLANENDRERNRRNREQEAEAVRICREKVARHKLEMDLVSAEYTFDNSKLLFYFTAEGRVDFRDLVRDLASTFHTRIELRQIGIRDEAKFLGGLGACGRPYCCATFLPDFTQVSIKMAKEQNFSLNSAKISGACGRLMCCLRYEHESYEAALKTTPGTGSLVSTPEGEGIVIETRPLLQQVKVRLTDKPETPHLFSCGELSVLRTAKAQRREQNAVDKNASPAAEEEKTQEREKRNGKGVDLTSEKPDNQPGSRTGNQSESRQNGRSDHRGENRQNGRPEKKQGGRRDGCPDHRGGNRQNGHPDNRQGNRPQKTPGKDEGTPPQTTPERTFETNE